MTWNISIKFLESRIKEFLKKINALIEEYGNAVITDDISLCVKTDESIRLKDWYDKMSYGNNKQD